MKRPTKPAVSIITPAFNAGAFIDEAINSILIQNFTDFELIIVDDGSTDATADIVHSVKDTRVKIVSLQSNVGLARAKNHGIDLAQGKYIAICDADDIQLPHRIAEQVTILDSGYDVTGCAGLPFGDVVVSPIPNPVPLDGNHELSKARSLFQSPFADFGTAYRTSFLREHRLRFTSNGAWEDWDMYQQMMAAGGRVYADPRPLVHYRRHAGQTTSQNNARRTLLNMRTALSALGLTFSDDELRLHHAISPFPYGPWTDEPFIRACGDQLLGLTHDWFTRLAQANHQSKWTSPAALTAMCAEVMVQLKAKLA